MSASNPSCEPSKKPDGTTQPTGDDGSLYEYGIATATSQPAKKQGGDDDEDLYENPDVMTYYNSQLVISQDTGMIWVLLVQMNG